MKMKAQEIHGMTNDELATKLADLKDELFNLHFRQATGQLENPTVIRRPKRTSRESRRKYAREKLKRAYERRTEDGKEFKKRKSRNSYFRQNG